MERRGGVIRTLTFIFSLCSLVFFEFCDLGALFLFKLQLKHYNGNSAKIATCGEVMKIVR